jgi:hypothetical protein
MGSVGMADHRVEQGVVTHRHVHAGHIHAPISMPAIMAAWSCSA